MFTLVRHAHAGNKRRWSGPDAQRPLTNRGWHQAAALTEIFADRPVLRIISSPFTRCTQTLRPLATAHDLEIETTQALAPDAGPDDVLALIDDPTIEGTVLCTHGEVLTDLFDRWRALRAPALPGDTSTAKGGSWTLTGYLGRGPTAHYQPPGETAPAQALAGATSTWVG